VRRVTLLLVVATALWPVTPAASQEVQPRPEIEVTWSMAPRFGLDDDADGLTDFLNTTAYVHNRVSGCSPCPEPRFTVRLEASTIEGVPVAAYAWRLTGSGIGGLSEYHELGPSLDVMLPEGHYLADVRAVVPLPGGTVELRGREPYVVDDLLVVAIGPPGPGTPCPRGPAATRIPGERGTRRPDDTDRRRRRYGAMAAMPPPRRPMPPLIGPPSPGRFALPSLSSRPIPTPR